MGANTCCDHSLLFISILIQPKECGYLKVDLTFLWKLYVPQVYKPHEKMARLSLRILGIYESNIFWIQLFLILSKVSDVL